MYLNEQGHYVLMIDPQTQTAALTSESISMANYDHASILIAGGAGSASTVTVFDAATAAASGASMVFNYCQEATAGEDVMDAALAAATTAGVAIPGGTGTMFCIEIDADELRDGYPFLLIRLDAAGSKLISALCTLTQGRYQSQITPSAES